MKIIGYLIVVFAFVDFGLSWVGTDVWYDWFGIQVPSIIHPFTAFIMGAIGYALISIGGKGNAEPETTDEQ